MVFGVLVERRLTANAIRLHDPTISELRKKFCFPETKKYDFCILPNVGLAPAGLAFTKLLNVSHHHIKIR
jgi:hypothetical protein